MHSKYKQKKNSTGKDSGLSLDGDSILELENSTDSASYSSSLPLCFSAEGNEHRRISTMFI